MIKNIIMDHILFVGLTKDRFNELAHTMGIVEIPVGQFLLSQGHLNHTMYIVKQGDFSLLRVFTHHSPGRRLEWISTGRSPFRGV